MLHVLLERWQPLAAVLGFFLFWIWEARAPFFPRAGRVRHAARNLTVAGINAVALAVLFAGATVAVADYSAERGAGLLRLIRLPEALHAAAAFVLLDAWTYWWHRANHRVRFLWRFHRMHHSDPEMDVTTATRFHLGEIAMSSLLRLGLIPIAGIPLTTLLVYDLLLLVLTQFHHANLALTPGVDQAVRWFVVSPNMHKVHHSRWQPETDSNYTSVLSVWDRIFGTYREKEDCRAIRLGLEGYDADDRQSVTGLLATPLGQVSPQSR